MRLADLVETCGARALVQSSALVRRLREAPWEGVKTDVERFLERPAEAWMVEHETVLGVIGAARVARGVRGRTSEPGPAR